ncbi:proteasome activator complex subunit 4 isoform X4 [Plutella xylostella]|uniref:proteasome activator complex subunit 4 isoform X4 n=2 Tax=Plutella xylostella TaxID=51655 RepID=UPI0020330377|nr:proteasome activator complex subunit 4 isoform X4 [Plutella xylostella]
MSDDENEYEPTPERIQALGFKPQKEILINTLLPYADQLDDESTRLFQQIKENLAKAVMLREMKPACGVWTARLMKFLRIYGLKFSKEDHIALVKLVYELVLIPDLEPSKIHKFATLFIMLTKKRYLITPDELTLPWRPLYLMGKKIFDKSRTHIGMYHYLTPRRAAGGQSPGVLDMIRKFLSGTGLDEAMDMLGMSGTEAELPTSLESSYLTMVKCAKPYFELSATAEILAEFRPQLAPWSSDNHLLSQLAVLLPVSLPPARAALGHHLWLQELMQLWDTCNNSQCGVSEVMMLFSSLAKRNPGTVDWTPHVPKMFTRFLHAVNLPVSYKDMQYTRSHSLDTKYIASWIVWTIAPDGLVLKHLRIFLTGIESYLHSANSGRWSFRLRDLLRKLSKEFLMRVRRERDTKYRRTWENETPDGYKLRDQDITEFVQIVLEPTLLAVHSRSGSVDVSAALQNMATLRPALVIPPLLERLRTSLESLTEPHRVTAAMSAVAAVARPMLRGPAADYPEGPTHVVPLLMGALPGLDPNDIKKTLVSLHFILIFSWMVPYIDCSSAADHWSDLTEEELLTCESTAQFEDFVLLFFERLFGIVESSVLENVRLESKESDALRSKTESVIETALSSAATSVLMQCSPRIFDEALRKFKHFATDSTFETNVAGSIVGVLLRVFARVNSEATLAAFVPQLCEEINELLSTDEALREENPPCELVYRLLLLSHAVECDGKVLIKYIPQITTVLDRALKLHAKDAIMRACDILGHIMASMSVVELREFRSTSKDFSKAPKEWLPIREWGKGCPLKEAKFVWHTPSEEEVACAQKLLDKYMKPELTRLRQWLDGERDLCRKRRLRCFYIINALTCCGTLLPPPEEAPVELVESLVPATTFPLASGVRHHLTLEGDSVRVSLARLLLRVQDRMLDAAKADDTKGLEMLIQVWERVSGIRPCRSGPGMEARMRSYAALERALDGKGGPPGGGRIRTLLADAVRLQDEARIDLQNDAGIGPTGLSIMNSLFQLSINTYTSVRILAQVRLYWMISHHAYSFRALLPQLKALLATGGTGEEWHARHKGALYIMLGPRVGPLVAKQDWEVLRVLWPAILTAPLSEKPSIMRLEQAFSETLHRQFPNVNTELTVPQSCVDAAEYFLTTEQKQDKTFVEHLSKAVETERATSDRNVATYNALLEEMVRIAEAPNIPWRRLELIMQMLTYCPSLQTPYPPSAVRLIVNCLIHDDIAVRRTAIRLTHFALKQRKHKVKKITIDPYEAAGVPKPGTFVPGYRKDLEWVIWDESRVPKTDEDWDKPWLRNSSVGFYAWPEKLEVAAPASQQVPLDRDVTSMEEGERHIFEFFTNEANINRLVAFLTVEEKKGKDKFSGSRFAMFRLLFRSYGERVTNTFLSLALPRAADSQEASQRFAAEVAAAAIRAPRYWPRAQAQECLVKATDVLQAGLAAVTPETMEDWGTCIASAVENLDPNRSAVVISSLVESCAPQPTKENDVNPDQTTSFAVQARLYALQGALGSLTWRTAPLAAQILRQLEEARFIQHPYQNVRESIGSLLMTIFDTELSFPGGSAGPAPRLAQFLADTKPKLAALYDEHGEIVIKSAASMPSGHIASRETVASVSTEPDRNRGESLVAVTVGRYSPDAPGADDATPQGGADNPDPDSEAFTKIVDRTEKRLSTRLEAALRLGGDSAPGPREHARAVNLLTTVLRGCMGIIVRGVNGAITTQYELMRTACALSARGPPQPHDELGRAADGFLASLAMAHHGEDSFDIALAAIEDVATSRSWWARLACVEFAQPLLFYGLPMMCKEPSRAVRAEEFALKLMQDSRLEVRQGAAKLLTGLMHCQALPNENATLNKLMKFCRSKELVTRHSGVLGLCAYLSSRPYSLGPRIGIVLAELSRHTNAPDPVPSTLRTALADFRRTHQDDWPKHRENLTEEELDLLADLTSPPTYCA